MIIKVLESFLDSEFKQRRFKGKYYLYKNEDRAKEIIESGLAVPIPVTEVRGKKKKKKE